MSNESPEYTRICSTPPPPPFHLEHQRTVEKTQPRDAHSRRARQHPHRVSRLHDHGDQHLLVDPERLEPASLPRALQGQQPPTGRIAVFFGLGALREPRRVHDGRRAAVCAPIRFVVGAGPERVPVADRPPDFHVFHRRGFSLPRYPIVKCPSGITPRRRGTQPAPVTLGSSRQAPDLQQISAVLDRRRQRLPAIRIAGHPAASQSIPDPAGVRTAVPSTAEPGTRCPVRPPRRRSR